MSTMVVRTCHSLYSVQPSRCPRLQGYTGNPLQGSLRRLRRGSESGGLYTRGTGLRPSRTVGHWELMIRTAISACQRIIWRTRISLDQAQSEDIRSVILLINVN